MRKRNPRRNSGRRKSLAYFFTSFFVTVLALGCAAGILVVDRNSQKIGWNDEITAFAFSSSGKKLNLTVMGNEYTVDRVAPESLRGAAAGFRRGYEVIEVSPLRLLEEAQSALRPCVRRAETVLERYLGR